MLPVDYIVDIIEAELTKQGFRKDEKTFFPVNKKDEFLDKAIKKIVEKIDEVKFCDVTIITHKEGYGFSFGQAIVILNFIDFKIHIHSFYWEMQK